MRIARFVDMQACKSIFSECSTFVLRSAEHYRRLYETDRGDGQELEVSLTGGGWAQANGVALSCWTMLDGGEPTRCEWSIFSGSVVAIVSTPSRVCTFLKSAFEIGDTKEPSRRRFPFMYVEHKEVIYADEVGGPITSDNIMQTPVFTKRLRFAGQKEYRFALAYSIVPHIIDSYIFCRDPDEYVDKWYVNPEMGGEKKECLMHTLLVATAGYGHFGRKRIGEIIANADALSKQP